MTDISRRLAAAEWAVLLETAIALLLFLGVQHAVLDVHPSAWSAGVPLGQALAGGGILLGWPALLFSLGALPRRGRSPLRQAGRALAVCSAGTVLVAAAYSLGGSTIPMAAVALFWVAATSSTLALRSLPLAWKAVPAIKAPHRVIIVGSGPRAARLYWQIATAVSPASTVIGFVDTKDCGALQGLADRLGTVEELESILMRRVVDEVLVALPIKSCYAEIQQVIGACERMGTESRYLADVFECSLARPRFEASGAVPLVAMKVFYDDSRLLVKRAVDVAGAAVGLVVLAPVFLLVALAVKATSPGPVLFTQERYGLNKRRFRMYKFRTMVASAEDMQEKLEALNEASGAVFKIQNDPRITRVGRFLRRTSLDETPQLVNVLLGHMSLVGPRPLPIRDVSRFDQPWFMRRFSVRPGLTCLWQVRGRSSIGFDDWMALDLEYIDRWSLGLDLRILARTVPAVFAGTGAS